MDYILHKISLHIQSSCQTWPQRPQKWSNGTQFFSSVKVPFLYINWANHPSWIIKKVKICQKTSLARRSTGFRPSDPKPIFFGSFWWHLTPVSLHLKSKIIDCPYLEAFWRWKKVFMWLSISAWTYLFYERGAILVT